MTVSNLTPKNVIIDPVFSYLLHSVILKQSAQKMIFIDNTLCDCLYRNFKLDDTVKLAVYIFISNANITYIAKDSLHIFS